MSKDEIYNIAVRIFTSFNSPENTISKPIFHKQNYKFKYYYMIPNEFTLYDKTTILCALLHINYTFTPKSQNKMFSLLKNIESKDITLFKDFLSKSILEFKTQIKRVEILDNLDSISLINLLIKKEINFITFIELSKRFNFDYSKSRIYKTIFDKNFILYLFIESKLK